MFRFLCWLLLVVAGKVFDEFLIFLDGSSRYSGPLQGTQEGGP